MAVRSSELCSCGTHLLEFFLDARRPACAVPCAAGRSSQELNGFFRGPSTILRFEAVINSMTLKQVLSIIGVFSILFSTCALFSFSDDIPVKWPEECPAASELSKQTSWTIHWLTESGKVKSSQVSGNEELSLSIPREIPLIVAAWPHFSDNFQFWHCKPAGFVQGTAHVHEKIELNWLDGFAAEFLLELAQGGMNMRRLNIDRFRDTISARSHAQPWKLDRQKLAADIRDKSLWVYSITLQESMDISLPLPAGIWYSSYPPDPPLIVDDSEWIGSMVNGLHQFIRPSDGTVAEVWINERNVPVILLHGAD